MFLAMMNVHYKVSPACKPALETNEGLDPVMQKLQDRQDQQATTLAQQQIWIQQLTSRTAALEAALTGNHSGGLQDLVHGSADCTDSNDLLGEQPGLPGRMTIDDETKDGQLLCRQSQGCTASPQCVLM